MFRSGGSIRATRGGQHPAVTAAVAADACTSSWGSVNPRPRPDLSDAGGASRPEVRESKETVGAEETEQGKVERRQAQVLRSSAPLPGRPNTAPTWAAGRNRAAEVRPNASGGPPSSSSPWSSPLRHSWGGTRNSNGVGTRPTDRTASAGGWTQTSQSKNGDGVTLSAEERARATRLQSLCGALSLSASSSGVVTNSRRVSRDDAQSVASDNKSMISSQMIQDMSEPEIGMLLQAALDGENFSDAVGLCRHLLEHFGISPERLCHLSNALTKMGSADDGLREAERAIEMEPDFAKGWLMKAKALKQLGDVSGTFRAMMRCEKLVSKKTGQLQPKVRVMTEKARKGRANAEVVERRRARMELRTPPKLLHNPEPEYPWDPPHQRASVKGLQDLLRDIEQGVEPFSRRAAHMVSGLRKELNELGPRWWVLKADDEIDKELLAPPPSEERKHILDEIFCCDLDSFLLAAVIGAGNLHDRTGQLQHQARLLLADLLLEEGVTVLSREQQIQSSVLRQAGIPLAAFLHTSTWRSYNQSPESLHAAARVSCLVAFQHLFELHARHVMPLVDGRPPLSPARLASTRFQVDEVERWQVALEAFGPWLEAHLWRLAASEAQLALHSILASGTRGKPDATETCAHDAHSFLFHIIKLCTSFGLDGLYERIAHPKGVQWLLSTYHSRTSVYQGDFYDLVLTSSRAQAAYHELNLERRLGDGVTDFKFATPVEPSGPEKAAKAAKIRTSLSIEINAPARRPTTAAETTEPPPAPLRRLQSAKLISGIANWTLDADMDASALHTRETRDSIMGSSAMIAQQAIARMQRASTSRRSVRYNDDVESLPSSPDSRPPRSPLLARTASSSTSLSGSNPMSSPASSPMSTGMVVRAAARAFRRNLVDKQRGRVGPKADAILAAERSFRVPEPQSAPPVSSTRGGSTNWWEAHRGPYSQLLEQR